MSTNQFLKKRKNDAVYLLAFCARTVASALPRSAGLAVFGSFGRLFFSIPTKDRIRTIQHLRLIYGRNWPEKRIWSVARNVYANLGKNLFDAYYLSRAPAAKIHTWVHADNFDQVREAYALGRGVLIITAHVGCYEMLLHYFAKSGLASFAIGQRLYDERLDRMVREARSGENIEYMYRTENPRAMLRLLSQGKTFGVLVDQDTRTDGVYARFLGRVAYTPSAPVKLALRYEIPAFVVTTARQPDDTHRIFIQRLDLQRSGDRRRDIVFNVQRTNNVISETIQTYPEQWVWMHRRWRRPRSQYPQAPSITDYE